MTEPETVETKPKREYFDHQRRVQLRNRLEWFDPATDDDTVESPRRA